jgi:hypothetical protein
MVRAQGKTFFALANFFKQLFGAGILALPRAFASAGLVSGITIFSGVLVLCACSLVLLVHVKQTVRARLHSILESRGGRGSAAEEEAAAEAVEAEIGTYPALARFLCGRWAWPLVAFAVCVLELAFCAGWVIVASGCIATVGEQSSLKSSAAGAFLATQWHVVAIMFPILCGLSLIRFLRDMWWLSVSGFFVYLFGVIGVVLFNIVAATPLSGGGGGALANGTSGSGTVGPASVPIVAWDPRFAGTALYALEAILMALPMERSLRAPEHAPRIIVGSLTAYAAIAVGFAAVAALFGYGSCSTNGGALVTDCMVSLFCTVTFRANPSHNLTRSP